MTEPINLLSNPSFEGGWTDQLPYGGRLTNQCPADYDLTVRLPGTSLISAGSYGGPDDDPIYDTVAVVPECVHKTRVQLPDADELILDGDTVYKIFSATNPFSVDLIAQVLITEPGTLRVVTPIQVHNHGDGSPGAAVLRLIVNDDYGPWLTFGTGFIDRMWHQAAGPVMHVMPGQVITAILQMESRALGGIDFFTDAWQFLFTPDNPEDPEPKTPSGWTPPAQEYERTYVLMPPDCGRAWPAAAIAATWDTHRFTVGGSADDAGIGPEARTVLAVNPSAWEGSLSGFFEQYYPGIEYVAIGAPSPADLEAVLLDYIHGGVSPPPEPEPPPDPEPEPPPAPAWKPYSFVPNGTKLGWHAIGDAGQSTLFRDLLPHQACPPSVKFIVDVGPASLIKAYAPSTKIIGRFIDGPGGNYEGFSSDIDLEWQANHRLAQLMPLWSFHRDNVDYWEIINEQDPPFAAGQARLAQYFIYAMNAAEANGYKLALFSHSTGVPEPEEWDAIAETGVFERAAAGGHCLSLHEYGEWPIDLHSHLARYRDVYERHIMLRQLDLPLYITEHAAWVHLLDRGPDWLWAQLVEYDRELRKDSYVAGAHIYSVGPGPTWYNDCYVALYPRFKDYCIAQRDVPNV